MQGSTSGRVSDPSELQVLYPPKHSGGLLPPPLQAVCEPMKPVIQFQSSHSTTQPSGGRCAGRYTRLCGVQTEGLQRQTRGVLQDSTNLPPAPSSEPAKRNKTTVTAQGARQSTRSISAYPVRHSCRCDLHGMQDDWLHTVWFVPLTVYHNRSPWTKHAFPRGLMLLTDWPCMSKKLLCHGWAHAD